MTLARVALDDGAATTLERWGARGPLVLAVHGMTSSRKSWERLARHLDGRFRLAAYDQRGHGDSAAVAGPMTLARGVADARNVAAALGEPIDVLIGHSWGGAVAILAAPQLDASGAGASHSRALSVVAIDPMIRQVSDPWYEEYLEELREQFALTGDARDASVRAEYAAWAPLDVEGKVHAVHAMTVDPIEGLRRENPPHAWDLRDAIARFETPLLLAMAAPGESINDERTLAEIAANHPPNVEIVTLPGGHNLHRTEFAAFAATLDAFLSG